MRTARAQLDTIAEVTERETAEALPSTRRRKRRKRGARSRTIRIAQLRRSAGELTAGHRELPTTRAECENGPRPCPHVTCKHHLYLDVSPTTGAIKLNFPDLEVWEMSMSCALDIADEGGVRLDDIGALLNITRERARQIESRALEKLSGMAPGAGLKD